MIRGSNALVGGRTSSIGEQRTHCKCAAISELRFETSKTESAAIRSFSSAEKLRFRADYQ